MTSREVKFITRIIVMMMIALVAALGARIFLESEELRKLVAPTPLRDMLIFLGPIASLSIIHYNLALRSYGMRSIKTEGLTFVSIASVFLMITMPYYFRSETSIPGDKCAWWKAWGCSTTQVKLNYYIMISLGVAGAIALVIALKNEKIIRR